MRIPQPLRGRASLEKHGTGVADRPAFSGVHEKHSGAKLGRSARVVTPQPPPPISAPWALHVSALLEDETAMWLMVAKPSETPGS